MTAEALQRINDIPFYNALARLDAEWRPVLRARDFDQFDLDRAFETVPAAADSLRRRCHITDYSSPVTSLVSLGSDQRNLRNSVRSITTKRAKTI